MKEPILLLTRPREFADRFVESLDEHVLKSTQIVISSLLEIVGTGVDPDLEIYDGVIFTSGQGVKFARVGAGKQACCVGETTTQSALAAGWNVIKMASTVDELFEQMVKDKLQGRFVHLAGRHQRGNIAGRLEKTGVSVDLVTLYEQHLLPLSDEAYSALSLGRPVIAPLFSPRTASHFATQVIDTSHIHIVAMSDAVAKAFGNKTVAGMLIADAPTGQEMRRCVEKLLLNGGLA
tara:strand:- start:1109 stop:1813 length:705 start_codon:yes stop_codon:yes gene_type:complete